jgi:hypothetical protein
MQMREIKFRAWDGKQFIDSRSAIKFFLSLSGALLEEDDDGVSPMHGTRAKHIIVQQFTGLHDKHGREIFEGDILEDSISKFSVGWNMREAKFEGQMSVGFCP